MKTYADYPKQPERRMIRRLTDFATRIGWAAIEEVAVPVWRGRADLILQPRPNGPIWLIEAKQTIATNNDLRDAITQAIGYRPFISDTWGEIATTVVTAEQVAPKLDRSALGNPHGVVVLTTVELRQRMKAAERRTRIGQPAINTRQERHEHLESMRRQGKLAAAFFGQEVTTDDLSYFERLVEDLRR